MTAALNLLVLASSSSSSKSSSSGNYSILILIAVGAGFYFLFFRPQQRKAKAQREQQRTFEVGDEVLTAGGMVGQVLDIEGDRVTLETSVGASFVVLKPYVVRRLEEPTPTEDEHEPDELEAHDDELDASVEHEDDGDGGDSTAHDELEETAGEAPAGPSANGAKAEDHADTPDGAADMWGETPPPRPEGGGTGRRRSGGRKRRTSGETSGGAGGPDAPSPH
jgi:preprotein translocase subunit YajC